MDDPKNDYEVGYKKPPQHTRFQPGQSGNPKGRKKGTRNLKTIAQAESNARIKIQENGVTRTISKQEAIIKQVTNKAAQGDPRFMAIFFDKIVPLLGEQKIEMKEAPTIILEGVPVSEGDSKENPDEEKTDH